MCDFSHTNAATQLPEEYFSFGGIVGSKWNGNSYFGDR
jgi:hypothetical protein